MEEVIEALQQHAIPQSFPTELPSEDDLVEIEEELLLPIPYEFKLFLLNASNLVCGSLEPVTAGDPQAHTHLPEVTAQAWELGMSREMLAVCQCGDDFYCMDQNGEVFLWQDGEMSEDSWQDIWQWVQEVWLES